MKGKENGKQVSLEYGSCWCCDGSLCSSTVSGVIS